MFWLAAKVAYSNKVWRLPRIRIVSSHIVSRYLTTTNTKNWMLRWTEDASTASVEDKGTRHKLHPPTLLLLHLSLNILCVDSLAVENTTGSRYVYIWTCPEKEFLVEDCAKKNRISTRSCAWDNGNKNVYFLYPTFGVLLHFPILCNAQNLMWYKMFNVHCECLLRSSTSNCKIRNQSKLRPHSPLMIAPKFPT